MSPLWENRIFLFTSLFDNRRELSNIISSFIVDCISDEQLNIGTFDTVGEIWTLLFLCDGLRGGIAGGISSGVEGTIWRLYFLCEGDVEADLAGINKVFDVWCSSSNALVTSVACKPWSLWSDVRPAFRLN